MHGQQLQLLSLAMPEQLEVRRGGRVHDHQQAGRNHLRLSGGLHLLFVWLERTLLGRNLPLHVLLQHRALLLRRRPQQRRGRNHLSVDAGSVVVIDPFVGRRARS